MAEEEFLVYKCERVHARVERIRVQAKHAEENPQEANMPLVRLLRKKIQGTVDEYEELYMELIDVCEPAGTTAYEKKRKDFLKLFRETFLAIQSMEISLLYPPVQYQPVLYVPVQVLQPQETRIQTESTVAPGGGQIKCSVATCSQVVESTLNEPTSKVGAPAIPQMLDVNTSQDVHDQENLPAVSEKPSLKVDPPQTATSSCEPAVAAESAPSPTMLDSQVTVATSATTAAQATPTDEKGSSRNSRASTAHKNQAKVAIHPSTVQRAVASTMADFRKPARKESCHETLHRDDLRLYNRGPSKEPSCIGSMKQQRPRDRKWRYKPRAPASRTTYASTNRNHLPDPDSSMQHLQQAKKPPDIQQFPVLSEAFQPSAGGRMFGLHPNVLQLRDSTQLRANGFQRATDATLPT